MDSLAIFFQGIGILCFYHSNYFSGLPKLQVMRNIIIFATISICRMSLGRYEYIQIGIIPNSHNAINIKFNSCESKVNEKGRCSIAL